MIRRNVLKETAGKEDHIGPPRSSAWRFVLRSPDGFKARPDAGRSAAPTTATRRWLLCGVGLLLCALAAIGPVGLGWTEETRSPLDADTLINVLRTRDADEESYCLYVSALVEQGQLPVGIAMGAMQWARQKPEGKRVQYFKHALIRLAADQGITMPEGTPERTGTIRGRCVVRVLGIDIPVVGGTVRLGDTKVTATTDSKGRFEFAKVPFGRYRLQAEGVVSLITRRGSAEAVCPSPPPSTEPTYVGIVMK